MEDVDYLTSDFDPSSVTVPRLRSILVEHNVNYPASAKKGQLVEIFNQQVAPKIAKLRKSRARTEPSTQGISNAPGLTNQLEDDDIDNVAETVEETPRRSSRRVTSRGLEDVSNRALPQKRASTARSGRASTGSRATTAETDRTETQSRRKSRRSLATPSIKEEDSDAALPGMEEEDEREESYFSKDNPFQSGSSPMIVPEERSKKDNRRKTFGLSHVETRKKSPSRRKTDIMPNRRISNGVATPASANAKELWLRPREEQDMDDLSSVGEEFTPEEQEELEQEEAELGQLDVLRTREKHATRKTNSALKTAPWAILVAMLGGVAAVWRQEKLEVGFCGVGRPSTSLAGVEVPEWGHDVLPKCEPCPQHAYCYANLEVTCEQDFVLQSHPLSLGGLVPLPPRCEPDGEKVRKVKAVADRAVSELRGRNAKWECGELKDEQGRKVSKVELAEKELKKQVSSRRKKGMSNNEFEELWQSAIGEILGRDEITTGVDGHLGGRTLRSHSLAGITLACAARRSIRLALARHLWKIVGLIALLSSAVYGRWSITTSRNEEESARRLASFALDRLATQAALHLQDSARTPEAWVSMGQLRDDVLRNEFSSRRRQRLWEKVQLKVEGNSNVRARVTETRSGEISRVWEWIGAVNALEDWTSGDRRESARLESSIVGSSPFGGDEGAVEPLRRWQESRPVY
ncbi:MAG: inner nuclear membrane protein enriched at telomere/subtelomere region [Alyxoria varia]|nr:MAG: inner nuclear membrane protein enriched at telomere/subtelomere region [Alyxoria varia]